MTIGTVSFSLSPELLAMVCLLVFAGGFVDAVAGGGGLISLSAYMVTGMPIHMAYGCNKFSSACGATFSTLRFLKHKSMDVKVAAVSALFSFAGSTAAARLVLVISEQMLNTIVIILLPVTAAIILMNKNYGAENRSHELSRSRALAYSALIGVFVGGYDGLFGPGAGTFAIILYALLMKYDLRTASGNAKLVNLSSGWAAVITFLLAGNVNFPIAIPAACCGILGHFLGAGFAIKKGARFIRPMMIGVLALLFVKLGADALLP